MLRNSGPKDKYYMLNDIFEPEQMAQYDRGMLNTVNKTLSISYVLDAFAKEQSPIRLPSETTGSYHRRQNTNTSFSSNFSTDLDEPAEFIDNTQQMDFLPNDNNETTGENSSLLFKSGNSETDAYNVKSRHRRGSSASKFYQKVGGLFTSKWK
ncbi:hypothetical protein GGI12_000546 [Dipsacomyces acuminosporus]|nr:hypothetical protein GGI12_000546 [Dipsacomyces acuminosporus]